MSLFQKKKRGRATEDYYLLSEHSSFSVREAYNTIRTNLMFMLSGESGCKIVAFSSCVPAEGKSSVASNVAISIASTGARVLLIDSDMRSPMLHTVFSVPVTPGLSDVLADFAQTRCVHKTSIPNLMLLPAGTIPPNPSELLISSNFEKLLKTLSESFDYILIDTPPVGVVTDACLIAPKSMGIALVARYNYTNKKQLADIKDMLLEHDCRVLGVIVNGTDPETTGYGRYGRYGHYGHYGKYGKSGYGYGYGYGYGSSGHTESSKNE